MVQKLPNRLSLRELGVLLIPWVAIFLLGVILVFIIGLSVNSKNFFKQVKGQTVSISLDLEQLRNNYFNQLRFIKTVIEDIGLDEQKIASFFLSNRSMLLDKVNLGTILITDKDFNIVYADKFLPSEYSKITIGTRDYKKRIQDFPREIVIGKAVVGVLTKKLAVPIAIGLEDKVTNKFIGALIFSLPLENFTRSFTSKYLKKISFINRASDEGDYSTYEELEENYIKIFLTKILFNFDKNHEILVKNAFVNTNILLSYDLLLLKKNFFIDYFLWYVTILTIILVGMWFLFNYYILKPLLPVLFDGNKLVNLEKKNIFNQIKEIHIIYQSLQEKSFEYQQSKEKFVAMAKYCNFITDQISNKAAILSEDIEDLMLADNTYNEFQNCYQEILKNIYHNSLNNQEEIKEILNITMRTIYEISNNNKERLDILQILTTTLKIDHDLVLVDSDFNNQKFSGMFFKNLLIGSLHTAMLYLESHGNIAQVILTDKNSSYSINFVYVRTNDNMEVQELDLVKCRAWALINCASVTIHYTRNIVALSFQLHQIL